MSYCKLITFRDGKPDGGIEYRNAWGGAARIWDALFDRYLKDPGIPNHSWIMPRGCDDRLWELAKRTDLEAFERSVHASTFDLFYVHRQHFEQFCADLRSFDRQYPCKGNHVNHLPAWAKDIESMRFDIEAVGFYGTSVGENPWWEYDEIKDESKPRSLTEAHEVYDWLATI